MLRILPTTVNRSDGLSVIIPTLIDPDMLRAAITARVVTFTSANESELVSTLNIPSAFFMRQSLYDPSVLVRFSCIDGSFSASAFTHSRVSPLLIIKLPLPSVTNDELTAPDVSVTDDTVTFVPASAPVIVSPDFETLVFPSVVVATAISVPSMAAPVEAEMVYVLPDCVTVTLSPAVMVEIRSSSGTFGKNVSPETITEKTINPTKERSIFFIFYNPSV